jgi:hypothetical protein
MEDFLTGAIVLANLAVALFFLRFWRDTGDRLFAIFSAAFVLLAVARFGLALSNLTTEGDTPWYWVRLAAYVLILLAILDKNRR